MHHQKKFKLNLEELLNDFQFRGVHFPNHFSTSSVEIITICTRLHTDLGIYVDYMATNILQLMDVTERAIIN